jgi:hypothetical protein
MRNLVVPVLAIGLSACTSRGEGTSVHDSAVVATDVNDAGAPSESWSDASTDASVDSGATCILENGNCVPTLPTVECVERKAKPYDTIRACTGPEQTIGCCSSISSQVGSCGNVAVVSCLVRVLADGGHEVWVVGAVPDPIPDGFTECNQDQRSAISPQPCQ